MADLPFPWCLYHEHQLQAARCSRVTDGAWGLENGLTQLLNAVEANSLPPTENEFRQTVGRAIATGSWNERNRARLRRKYLLLAHEPSPESSVLARVQFDQIRNAVTAAEWVLLMAAAAGLTCSQIAAARGSSAGSLRTRISRLRARLR